MRIRASRRETCPVSNATEMSRKWRIEEVIEDLGKNAVGTGVEQQLKWTGLWRKCEGKNSGGFNWFKKFFFGEGEWNGDDS